MTTQQMIDRMLESEADKRTRETFLRAFRILRMNAIHSARNTSGHIRTVSTRAARRANTQLVRLLRGTKLASF